MSTDLEIFEAYNQKILAAERIIKTRKARECLIDFAELMLPDPENPEDSNKSQFQAAEHHRIIAAALEEMERGNIRRMIITMPPRHGKSELCTRLFPAWFTAKNPGAQIIIAGYSESFAQEEFGSEIRNHMIKQEFGQIFPGCNLDVNSKSSSFLKTTVRNKITITGVGGKINGKGADLMIIDDPIKNDEEADSLTSRNRISSWFNSTVRSRMMPGGRILVIMTRWHEDDLVGRILDPQGPAKNAIKKWKILHLPAIFNEGTKKEKALWPAWYPLSELHAIKEDMTDKRWWYAMYQGTPAPEDGDYFKKKMFITYKEDERPPLEQLRIYGAMDLAVSKGAANDKTCLLIVGVDREGTIWVLDALWERLAADELVEDLVISLLLHKPMIVWGEKGQIAKSVGPFLRKRMKEKKCWTLIEESSPTMDKQARSRSSRGRMSMGMIKFPINAHWWPDAEQEMLKFPNGKHDDFVDALSLIGLGLDIQIPGSKSVTRTPEVVTVGTVAWMKKSSDRRKKLLNKKKRKGW
ncbi:MAG: phage terminase large subunit [Bacteroidota bacterium]